MSKRTPKNTKNWHNTPIVLCWHEKFFESNNRQWISFCPQRWDKTISIAYYCFQKISKQYEATDNVSSPKVARSLTKPSRLLWEALVSEKLIHKAAQMGQKIYHGMLMSLHDSMPSFMNFRRVLDLLEIKSHVSQCLRPSYGGRVFEIHSHFLHGT